MFTFLDIFKIYVNFQTTTGALIPKISFFWGHPLYTYSTSRFKFSAFTRYVELKIFHIFIQIYAVLDSCLCIMLRYCQMSSYKMLKIQDASWVEDFFHFRNFQSEVETE